jgi:hypothetical protein
MLEILVLSLCLGQYECSAASKAYYAQHPRLKVLAQSAERRLKKGTNETILYTAPAIYALATGQPSQFRISKYFSCGGAASSVECKYTYSF